MTVYINFQYIQLFQILGHLLANLQNIWPNFCHHWQIQNTVTSTKDFIEKVKNVKVRDSH